MKRIILTESQYKRLVKQPLNEQEIIFGDGYSFSDMKNVNNIYVIVSLHDSLWYNYKQNLYIKSVDEDKVIIDLEKYDEEVKEFIKKTMDMFLITSDNPGDSIDDEGNIDFSFDTEPVEDEEQEVVDNTSKNFKCIDSKWNPIFSLINKAESPYGYESLYPGTSVSEKYETDLFILGKRPTEMTFKEIADLIGPGINDTDNPAVGMWQFISLLKQAKKAGFNEDDLFSKCNQDKIAMYLMKGKRKVTLDLIKTNPNLAGNRIAMEWAGMPCLTDFKDGEGSHKRGESYYEGSVNTSHVDPKKVESTFKKMVGKTEDETVTVKDVPNIPFRNKTEGNAFRKWVNDNHKEYADKINLSPTGDWKEGQKNFKGFMLKAWNEHGKKYIDDGGYKELEDIETSNGGCKLSKCQFRTKKGCKTFDELTPDSNMGTYRSGGNFFPIPDDNNNFRSGALRAEQMLYALETYDIKKIISFDDGEDNTLEMKNSEEEKFIECYNKSKGTNVEWIKISAHINPYKVGEGYVGTLNKVLPLIKDGNTLIHCTHGADRTGYVVAKHLKDLGKIESNEDLWNYTIKFNSWEGSGLICNPKKGNNGFIKYLEGFYPHKEWCKVGNRMKDCQSCKKYK